MSDAQRLDQIRSRLATVGVISREAMIDLRRMTDSISDADTELLEWAGRIPASAETVSRLEEIRTAIRSESASMGEIADLQSLARFIDPGDVDLLEWAGVPEFDE